MDWITEFFGAKILLAQYGNIDTKEVLKGKKFIGMYFSAHWCPPCKGTLLDCEKACKHSESF